MKKIISIPTLIGMFFLLAGIAGGIILIQKTKTFRLGASPTAAPTDVRVSNVTDTSFTVTWVTDSPTSGFIKYGTNQSSLNQTALPESEVDSTAHFVTLKELSAETTYFFKINSGGEDFDVSGTPWSASTGTNIGNPESNVLLSGKIVDQNGLAQANSLVFAQIESGSAQSAITSLDGNYLITLSFTRVVPSLSTYATLDIKNTTVNIFAETATASANAKIHPQSAHPAPDITLGKTQDFTSITPPTDDNIPQSSLQIPDSIPESSKFNVDQSPAQDTAEVTLASTNEGEVVTTTSPEFFGQAPVGTTLVITVESEPVTKTVTVGESGEWKLASSTLTPGPHKITILWRDAQGILRTLTRSFIVEASEGPSFEASSSGTLATTTPKASPTPASTTKPSVSPTSSSVPLPVSGGLTPTFTLLMMGVGVILIGLIVFLAAI